jgi:hypothetical protein
VLRRIGTREKPIQPRVGLVVSHCLRSDITTHNLGQKRMPDIVRVPSILGSRLTASAHLDTVCLGLRRKVASRSNCRAEPNCPSPSSC